MCEVAVCEGDDRRYAGERNRIPMSECHGGVCERRDTQVCVGGMETATEGQRPSSGRSYFGNRAGLAQRRARGLGRAAHETATCSLAGVKPGPETPAVDVSRSRGRTKGRLDNGFGTDGFSMRACV